MDELKGIFTLRESEKNVTVGRKNQTNHRIKKFPFETFEVSFEKVVQDHFKWLFAFKFATMWNICDKMS